MRSKNTVKPHRVRWAEAERVLAINWNLPPLPLVGHEPFPVYDEYVPMQPSPVLDPKEIPVELE